MFFVCTYTLLRNLKVFTCIDLELVQTRILTSGKPLDECCKLAYSFNGFLSGEVSTSERKS